MSSHNSDIGNFIYVIFMIIIAIAGIINKNKKDSKTTAKKVQPQKPVIFQPQPSQATFEEEEEELEKELTAKSSSTRKPLIMDPAKEGGGYRPLTREKNDLNTLHTSEKSQNKILKTDVVDEISDMALTDEASENEISEYALNGPDDLKKAIVYNEILQRKY